VNACGVNPCQNGANCVDTMGSYTCGPCPVSVTGYNCERRTYIGLHCISYTRVTISPRLQQARYCSLVACVRCDICNTVSDFVCNHVATKRMATAVVMTLSERRTMVLESRDWIHQVVAPCNGAWDAVCGAWLFLLHVSIYDSLENWQTAAGKRDKNKNM